jgi:HD superfamily phosphodiesterase
MQSIVDKARIEFNKMVADFGSDPFRLLPHVPEVEKWAKFLLAKNPQVDGEVVLLAVWLHDLGHYPLSTEIDHAVRGEERAKAFLEKEGLPADKSAAVLHCVRAHRNNDVRPETLEAKIIACADSASHMTDPMYFAVAQSDKETNSEFRAYAKMARDYRDLAYFPEVQAELKGLFDAWDKLIREYEKIIY